MKIRTHRVLPSLYSQESLKMEAQDAFEENDLKSEDLVSMQLYGMQVALDGAQPLLILKEVKGDRTMPVFLNSLEAAIVLGQANRSGIPVTPHKISSILLESLNVKFLRAVFVELKGMNQILRIDMQNHPTLQHLHCRVEDALSFCFHHQIPLLATPLYMQRSRVILSEVEENKKHLLKDPRAFTKSHQYLM